jgi:tetratricopeptide (TPR) repeat protein
MKLPLVISMIAFLCAFISVHAQVAEPTLLSSEKREQFVQKAIQFRKQEQYAAAIVQLDSILKYQPKDAGILLFKGDLKLQSKLYQDAVDTYKKLLLLNFETTITQINLSYALFMNHKPAKALLFAKMAWKGNPTNNNAIVNYFNAMLWNSKTKEAAAFLKQQDSLLNPGQKLVLQARLYTTGGNYNKGLKYYDSLAKAYPEKYYVQEYAEVLLGKKEMKSSATIMQQAKDLFTPNEYQAYQQKLQATQQKKAGTEMIYFKDVADNVRIQNSIWWQQAENRKYRIRLSAGVSTLTSAIQEKTRVQFGQIHISEKWNRAWSGETEINLQLINASSGNHFAGVVGKQSIQYQPNDRRMVGGFISTDILDFTASLLDKNIRSYNLGYVTHIMLSGKTGFYSQGSAGLLTDNNQRYQFFGSLYHLFRTEPTLKGGLNFSALHFKDNTVKNYFSPNQYMNTEVFIDYSTALPMLSKFYFQLQTAAGMQKIETQQWDPAFRIQTELGLRLKHIETAFKYQSGNVASAIGTGYSFNWYTLGFIWKW